MPLTSLLPALPLSVPTHCFCPIWRLIFSSAPLPTYLQLCAAPFPPGHGWAGLRQDSCGILIVTEAEPAAGSDSPQRGARPGINEPLGAAPASNCSPSNFPYPWEHCSTKKFHQLKCCTPEHLPNVPHLTKVYSSRRCC